MSGNNFGGQPARPPWFWRNPLANKLVTSSIGSSKMALNQQSTTITSDFTTTSTAGFQYVMSGSIFLPKGPSLAYFSFASFGMKHSAATATVDIVLSLADNVATYTLSSIYGVYVATANQIMPIHLSTGNSASDLSSVIRGQNLTYGLLVFNHTAGTLTIPGTGGNVPRLSAFASGDSSV